MFFKKSLFIVIALFALRTIEARADSFVIGNVEGFLGVSASLDAGPPTLKLRPLFNLSGPGLLVATDIPPIGGGDVGVVEARDTCQTTICGPGTVLGTNSSFSGIVGPFGSTAIVNGVAYQHTVVITGSLNFVSQQIVLPNVGTDARITIPFDFSGELTGAALEPGAVNPIFTATLSGHGMATFVFYDDNRNPATPRFLLDHIDYRFQSVPEPGTVILFSSGVTSLLAAMWQHRRRRK